MGAGRAVPDHEGVGRHRVDGQQRVAQRLALRRRRALGSEVERVGGQPLLGQLERRTGAGGVCEEEVDDRASSQRGEFFDVAALDLVHLGGRVENGIHVLAGEVGRGEEVSFHRAFPRPIRTSSGWASASWRMTWTRSDLEVGRFLPTKSARMGSSRWPRSISTASWTARGRPRSPSASRAARALRPEEATSSTRMTTLSSMPPGGIEVLAGKRIGPLRRSSRNIVMSSAPTGTVTPSTSAMKDTRRLASGTPRDGMPSTTSPSTPLLRSMISWATRRRARETSPEFMTTRAVEVSCRPLLAGAAAEPEPVLLWSVVPSSTGLFTVPRPPSPPHRTVVKGWLSAPPYLVIRGHRDRSTGLGGARGMSGAAPAGPADQDGPTRAGRSKVT